MPWPDPTGFLLLPVYDGGLRSAACIYNGGLRSAVSCLSGCCDIKISNRATGQYKQVLQSQSQSYIESEAL